jgi:hypothetical protein
MSPNPEERKAAAEGRVEVALASIQEAQRLIERATQALSAVNGLAAEWRKLGTLHDQAKRAWYAVTGKADSLRLQGRLTLDHAPDSHEGQWTSPARDEGLS